MRRLTLIVSLAALPTIPPSAGAWSPIRSGCTIAEPSARATLEARLPGAADFCELISQAVAGDVFHAPTLVTPNLWHYQGAALSCQLRYQRTPDRITIHESTLACDWLEREAPGWRPTRPDGPP